MSSRDYIRHLVLANTAPNGARVGDEYFDPVANKLYKVLAVNGTTVTSTEILIAVGGNTYTGNLIISGSSAAGNGITFADGTRQTTAATGTGSSGSSANLISFTTVADTFTGNGSKTQFTLSVVPDSKNSTFVYLNGVYQNKSTYSVVGANVIFTGIATANDTIEVTTVAGSVMNVSPSGYSTRIYQGNGSTTAFTISAGQTANTVMVFNNGIGQFPVSDYTVSGTTLTYLVAPQSDETVQIREMPINQLVAVTQPNLRRYTANGVQTTFTVTTGQTANSMFVYENGVCQMPINDYTVSGTTLTFTTAPTADKVIQIREMPV